MTVSRAFRPVLWFARRAGLAPTPLRRPVDRVDNLIMAVAVLLAVAAIPFAVMVGRITYQSNLDTAAAQAASRTQITAVLVQDAPSATQVPGVVTTTTALARWQWPAGTMRTGMVPATPGDPVGTRETIWVDQQGQVTPAPLTGDQAGSRGIITAILAWLGVVTVLTLLAGLAHWQLNRRRFAAWAAEWKHIGPQWTNHRI